MRLTSDAKILFETSAFPGVKRVAGKLAKDFELVFGSLPETAEESTEELFEEIKGSDDGKVRIVAATLGNSAFLDRLVSERKFDKASIEGKWEVYSFKNLEQEESRENGSRTLLIAGSDKRGTIYGIFHLSELLGVSPWYWFADVTPVKKDSIEITDGDFLVSKEPSVKYRGFFINDEWPSFGNWTFEHFGGFTAEMYDHVFELLLRLKGNYLWPAMWTSNFSLDGPGLENARLADEYGVVMSNSHHEPCLRHSEEWDIVKGDDTPYGSAWNFDRNREGLTNYWRDGLLRNGKFENIITMGMRGERDSEVLGATATLKDNIDYIKEVVTTQNRLIKETINEDLDSVPRMIAIYKEVEKYFHGDDNAEGLKHWEGLDGITCMLCEDNFGNLRTLPEEWHRDRKGGWGMYYHFDYHGDPISYEWINSTHISRTCEQMSQAYDYGIREIWIVNVGDLKPQEFPLSYFLDLAYDIDKWGQGNENAVSEYTKHFVDVNFPSFDEVNKKNTIELIDGYTHLNYIRKPEALNPKVYDSTDYLEAEKVHYKASELQAMLMRMKEDMKYDPMCDAFYQLVYYPAMAATNLIKMQLLAGMNHFLADIGATEANRYAEGIKKCISVDHELTDEYHHINGGKWNGMMLSEHIGFTHWNDEECAYPVIMLTQPANRPRMIVTAGHKKAASQGGDWTRQKLIIDEFLQPDINDCFFTVYNGSDEELEFSIEGAFEDNKETNFGLPDWLRVAEPGRGLKLGKSEGSKRIILCLNRDRLRESQDLKDGVTSTLITVRTKNAHVDIEVWAGVCKDKNYVPVLTDEQLTKERPGYVQNAVAANELGLTIEAESFELADSGEAKSGAYKVLRNFGKYGSGIKAFPTTKYFTPGKDSPVAQYSFVVGKQSDPWEETGETVELLATLITAPGNPVVKGNRMAVGISVNGDKIIKIPTVDEGYEGGERTSPQWANGVLTQDHKTDFMITAKTGLNTIRVYAADPGVVIERLLLRQAGTKWADGYLGKVPAWING
ncbi:MAG: glycosyl hydrolase 115 family protein [Lachnospiraceae bacterium]|nr:glycosyl hydrolase 115 family protein [Lachnospiraceae bacterium]